VAIDERKARRVARSVYGLRVIGAARILVEAKRRGYLKRVDETIRRIRDGGYWLHDDIVRSVLREAGEMPELS
jgi:predicted nucleic acid-binding protein